MDIVRDVLRVVHIALGCVGLAVFWIPLVLRKGSRSHRAIGRVFEWCVYAVAVSAIANSIVLMAQALGQGAGPDHQPASFGFLVFLCYLAIVTFASVRHGVRAAATKTRYSDIDTPVHRCLAMASVASSVAVVTYALLFWSWTSVIMLSLSWLGWRQGRQMWKYMTLEHQSPMEWWYAHMAFMIATGIAFHTAFLVFGASRFSNSALSGPFTFLPWILPAAVGVPALRTWIRMYKRQFGDLEES